MKRILRTAAFFAPLSLLCLHASAATITLNAIDSGTYRSTGANNAGSKTYVAGNCGQAVCGTSGVYRDFFVFDLAALAGIQNIQITDATLVLENPTLIKADPTFSGGYVSPNSAVSGEGGQPADTFAVFDVSSPLATVRTSHAAGNAAGTAIYNDLGSGTSYGSYVLTKSLNTKGDNSVVVVFNQDGVDALNGALNPFGASLFGVGGAFQDLPAFNKVSNQYIFQRTNASYARQLTITYTTADAPAAIPEPTTGGLTGGALLAISLLRRRFAQS
jgi:hypothetical protein